MAFIIVVISATASFSFQNEQQPAYKKDNIKIQIQNLAKESGRSSTKLQKALDSVDEINKLDNIKEISVAIKTIENTEMLYFKANQASDNLSNFIIKNKQRLIKSKLNVFIDIEELANDKYYTHRKALGDYINSYKIMLEYLKDNYSAVAQGQNAQKDVYNKLFFKYRTALEANNEAYLLYNKFVDHYLSKRPALAEIMSKARQDFGE
jgi:hypothetical protein